MFIRGNYCLLSYQLFGWRISPLAAGPAPQTSYAIRFLATKAPIMPVCARPVLPRRRPPASACAPAAVELRFCFIWRCVLSWELFKTVLRCLRFYFVSRYFQLDTAAHASFRNPLSQ
ncbi:hypothetical protein EVAR_44079_1 [Eumeta japonica]|uniref:Uncharacterized protein n=1 Tax=Eumeta variegata TaxID=151549 RepID=A0A4C1X2R0_EUMVA|nr:hypothetical protein EVAR_44079_1 [Eumeta japonica]